MSIYSLPWNSQPQVVTRVRPEFRAGVIVSCAPSIYDAARLSPLVLPSTVSYAVDPTLGRVLTVASQTVNAITLGRGITGSNFTVILAGTFFTYGSGYNAVIRFADGGASLQIDNQYGNVENASIVLPGISNYASTIAFPAGVPCCAVFAGTTGANYDVIIKNLVTGQVSASAGNTLGTPFTGSGQSYLLSDTSAGYGAGAGSKMALAGFINRRMSLAEAFALVQNHGQIFTPLPIDIYFGVAGGGATYTLTAESGSIAATGTVAALKFNRSIAAAASAIAISGTAATLKFNRKLSADTAAIAVSGTSAILNFNRKLSADAGSIAISGVDATLTYTPVSGATYTLSASPGSVAIGAPDASLRLNRKLAADPGSAGITGADAGLRFNRKLSCTASGIVITGIDIGFLFNRVLACDSGTIAINGTAATLVYGVAGTLNATDLAAIDALIVARIPDIAAAILAAAEANPFAANVVEANAVPFHPGISTIF